MSAGRLFLDTAFVQALYSARDPYHSKAMALLPLVEASDVWMTEAVLTEIGDALSAYHREAAATFIRDVYHRSTVHVVGVCTALLARALDLYASRPDKTWGLTDCISFIVMNDEGLVDCATTDRHFVQAGFNALLLAD